MSDTPILSDGSSDYEAVDETIQHAWDRYAMPDHSINPEWHDSPLDASADVTNVTVTARIFESRPENDSATGIDNAIGRPESTDVATEQVDAPDLWGLNR